MPEALLEAASVGNGTFDNRPFASAKFVAERPVTGVILVAVILGLVRAMASGFGLRGLRAAEWEYFSRKKIDWQKCHVGSGK